MKTRERILNTSLSMFNQLGVNHVSTLDIATELSISPGNLYYHFHGKDEIITHLFMEFESAVQRVAQQFESNNKLIEYWPYLHTILSVFEEYRFLFRDVENLIFGEPALKRRFSSLTATLRQLCINILKHLRETEQIDIGDRELEILADNIILVSISWLNYQAIIKRENNREDLVRKGVCRLIALVEPYLTPGQSKIFDDPNMLYDTLIK